MLVLGTGFDPACFIPNYAALARPLTDLLKDENEFEWGEEQENSFESLKKAITTAPVLQTPDHTKPFLVIPDASNVAIGGVLMQDQGTGMKPCAFMSYRLEKPNWSPYEIELWAMIRCLQVWKHHLIGSFFTIKSDHSPLQ